LSEVAALIVPEDPAFVRPAVCGTSLLLRSVCVFARTGARVYVLRTPACSEATVPDLPRALAQREGVAAPVWVDRVDAVPVTAGLFLLRAPAVIDARLAATLRGDGGSGRLARVRAVGDEPADLWYAGPAEAPTLVAALTGGDATARAAVVAHAVAVPPGDGLYVPITTGASVRAAEARLLARTSKASDTFIARNFDRHISHWLTRRLMHTGVTPNQVTIVSTLVGLAGVGLLLLGTYWPQAIGAGLVLLATIIDGVDGELARLKFLESALGRRLDFWLDNVVNATALFATGAGYGFATGSSVYVWASVFNLLAAAITAVPVYFLFFRPGAAPDGSRLAAVLGLFAGRDYAYLVFAMALLGIVHWFTWLCLAGLTAFLAAAVALVVQRTVAPAAQR